MSSVKAEMSLVRSYELSRALWLAIRGLKDLNTTSHPAEEDFSAIEELSWTIERQLTTTLEQYLDETDKPPKVPA